VAVVVAGMIRRLVVVLVVLVVRVWLLSDTQ
jgi:hypothetical protein